MCESERGGLRLHTKSFKSPEALGGRQVPSGKLIVTPTREKKKQKKKPEEPRSVPTAQTTAGRLEEREQTQTAAMQHVWCPRLPFTPYSTASFTS